VSVVGGVAGGEQRYFYAQKEGHRGVQRDGVEDGAATVTLGALNVTPYTDPDIYRVFSQKMQGG